MGTTIIGTTGAALPFAVSTAHVFVKASWSGSWQYKPEIKFEGGSEQSAAHGLGYVEISRPYGSVKNTYNASFGTQYEWNLIGYWVRITFANHQTGVQTTAWTGQILEESRDVYGNSNVRSGRQTWIAYSPAYLLDKYTMSSCYWYELSTVKQLGWIPPMNERDDDNRITGNRSTNQTGLSYVYGGASLWSNYDYLNYVLARFMGSGWYLGGQVSVLKSIRDSIKWDTTQTVAEVLRKLIPTSMGIDYTVFTSPWGGFVVYIFALVADSYSFNGATLPRNPNTVNIRLAGSTSEIMRARIVRSRMNKYSRIRVIGRRIIVCTTLSYPSGTLEKRWDSDIESDYDTPGLGADANDDERRNYKYDDVYQRYGAPATWGRPAPALWGSGLTGAGLSQYQRTVRRTLRWLPLRSGYDYSSNPATDNTSGAVEPDFARPMAWLYDEDTERYVAVDKKGVSLSVPENDWGVLLEASPNHLLALDHWTGGGAGATNTDPLYDYEKLVCTIALETDQRLEMEFEMSSIWGHDGTTMDVIVPDAELWYLAPNTVVGVNSDGSFKYSGPYGRVLRNDSTRIGLVMAGAIARYYNERARAEITIKRLLPYGGLVGQILAIVQEEGNSQIVMAPITSVEWFGDTTVIRTGYAGS